jgi:hypothetical protein
VNAPDIPELRRPMMVERREEMASQQIAVQPDSDVTDLSGGLLAVIARAARDPSVDVDKMERLFELQERVTARQAETAFNAAMNAAQAEMRPIATNASNPQTKSRYATFDKLDKRLRPIYTHHGFSLSFDEGESPKPEHVRVLCYVSHVAGHTRTYHRDMPADGKGAKGGDVMTKTHAAGAAGSYGARYLLKGIFNVAVGEEDRDGNGDTSPISAEQLETLNGLKDAVGADLPRFCRLFHIEGLRNLPASQYERAVSTMRQKNPRAADAFLTGGE